MPDPEPVSDPYKLDLDRLEALEKAATPGPWATDFQLLYFLTVGDCCLAATIRNALPQLLAMARRCEEAERERDSRIAAAEEEAAFADEANQRATKAEAELAELKATAIRAEREMAGIIEEKKKALAEAVRLLTERYEGPNNAHEYTERLEAFLAEHKETT